MPAWPTGIPFFTSKSDARRSAPVDNLIRTPMGVGPDKVRRRTSAAVKNRQGRIPYITKAQMATFETFYDIELAGGALSFTATDPFDDVERTFRFVGGYEIQALGQGVTITATLEILP